MISKTNIKSLANHMAAKKTGNFVLFLFAMIIFTSSLFAQTADITGPSNFNDCQQQTMTITIVNNGTDPATNVVVDYNYLTGFSFVSGTSLVTYPVPPNDSADPSDNGSRLRWVLTQDINPGETVTITFDLITNCVAESGTHSVTVTYDPGALTTSDTVYITVNHGALVVTKTPTVTNAFVGDTVSWTLGITSTGFGPASNIEITDDLGTGFTFISSTLPGGGLTYTHPSLAAGASLSYTVTARIDSCSNLENTLNVRWGCGGAVYCQNNLSSSASINLTVREPALQFVSISPSPIVFNFCQEATVTVSMRNNGTGPAVSPHLTPTLPSGYQITGTTAPVTWDGTRWTLPTIAAGNTVTFSFNLTTTDYCSLNNGLVLFDADCTNECGNPFTAPQIEIDTMNVLSDFPSLSVTKSAPNEIDVGQTIPYAITVSYNGNPSYSGDVTVVDNLPANIVPINITGGGVYNSGAGTITWVIPQASVVNGVILNASFDGPTYDTYPELCDYCFNTLTNSVSASTQLTCPLTPTLHCDLNASASASTRINCRDTGGTATVTGAKDAGFNTTENCTIIPYVLTFTFGTGITDSWSTLELQEMMNNGQTPSGDATFTVGAVTVTRPVPMDGNWGSLSFLDSAGAPGPAGQTLVVIFSLYQPNTGNYYNDAVLTVPSLGGGICGTGDQQVLVTELVNVEASTGSISVNVPTFLDQCETITVTLNVSKGTYDLYNPVVSFTTSDYTYVPGTATWSGDGVSFPGGNIEPSIAGSTLTWNNTQWSLVYLDSGANRYYSFQNGGTITFQAVKTSSCSDLPDCNANLYFDDNCERMGRNGAASTNLKSSASDRPIVLSKGNILIRKFPELVTATSDTVSFTVTLVNTGDGASYNTVITDILGDDMLFDPAYTGTASINPDTVDGVAYNPTITGHTLVFNLGDLDPNDVVQITIPARIIGCNESEMYNRAEGTWGCGGAPSDCQALPVSRQVNVNLQDSNLLIRGSGDVNLCEQNTLQLDILNSGRTVDYSVQAVFIIPTGLNYVPGSSLINGTIAGEPVQVGDELTWTFNSYAPGLGDLNPNDIVTLTFDVRTDCDLSSSVNFQAYGRYIAPCDNYVGNISNTVTYTLEINDNRANLQVTKAPASQTGELNDSITWTITIRNTGIGTGYHLEFYDALPAGVTVPALPGYGISNEALNGVPQSVFDDGLPVTNLGTVASPRTLIDIPPSGVITFDVTARVDSCSALTSQNQANVRWGCDDGCRFSYIPGSADLVTSPVIALLNHQLASESICGAVFSFDVQNTGSRAVSVNLVDTLPAGFVYAAGTATISSDRVPPRVDLVAEPTGAGTGTITWDATNIPLVYPGETVTITFEARNDVTTGNCAAPINGTNSIALTYTNSCGDGFGPINSTLSVVLNQPNFSIDVTPDTQIVPPATPVCWDVTVDNGAGGDIVDSVDIEITFGPDYDGGSITAGNGSDGTVPVIAGNTVTYYNISVGENSNWTANVCGTAITNPDVSQLWVSATATGECSSGCFYGTASDTSASAVGDIVKTVGPSTATIGDEVTYTVTVDYDGGSSNYQNVVITDTLPPDVSFVSQVSMTGPNAPVAPSCVAGVCTWNVGNFTSSPTGEQTVIVFTARVDNTIGNQNGQVRINVARATYIVNGYDYDESSSANFTIIEPDFNLTKNRNVATAEGGDTVTYTITATQTAASTSPAYDFVITDTIPSYLTYVAASQTSTPAATSFSQVGQVLTWTYDSVPIGTSPVVTFQTTLNYTVEPNQTITNPAQLTWTSLAADGSPYERNGTGGVNDYVRNASVNITVPNPSSTVTKTRTTPYENTIASVVHYQITADTIRGTMDNYRISDQLPDFITLNPASISVSPAAWPYTLTITGPNDGTGTTTFTLNFGTIVNTNPGNTNVVVDFDTTVADVGANDDGDILQNRGTLRFLNFAGTTVTYNSAYVNILLRVPALVTNKTITAVNGGAVTPTVGPGDIITYQYTVQNVGTGVANSVNITDTFPNTYLAYVAGSSRVNGLGVADPTGLPGPNLNFNLSNTINGGTTLTLTFNARVLSTVNNGTVINNISYATGVDELNNPIPADNTPHVAGDTDLDDQDNESITAAVPGLVVDKTVLLVNGAASTGIVQAGDTVRYQVTIQNVGGANALAVDLQDVLPSALFTYVNNSTTLDGAAAANPTIAGNTLTWDLNMTITGGNPVGQTRTIAFDVLVSSGIVQGTVYTNTSSAINGTDGNGTAIPTASDNPDDTDLDDTDTADLTGGEPALITDKIVYQVNGGAPTGTPPIVAVGDIVTFRYTVTNVGNATAHNLDLTDVLPAGFTYQNGSTNVTWPTGSYTSNPTIAGVNLSWNSSATLAASQVLTLQFNTVVQNAAFMPIPPSGQFENIASATADDGAGTAVPADNSAHIPADTDLDDSDNAFMQPAHPALVVDKSVVSVNGDPARTYTEPGDTVRYRVTIQNVGGAPALNVDLQDTIDANVTYIAGTTNASWNGAFASSHTADPSIVGSVLTWDSSAIVGGNGTVLSPSATVTYDFSVHVTSSVTQGGTILNTGYGTGVDGSGVAIPANNSANVPADTDLDDMDSVTLPTYKPGLITDKTVALVNGVASTGFIEPGDVITYQYTVQNVGQAVAYNVDITDTLPSSDFTYVPGSSTLGGVGIADPTIAGNNLTWNTNATIAGGNPTGATITLRFNVTVGSGIHQGTVYTNTNWAVNGTDGDGGAIATDSGDAQDNDLDDSDAVDLTASEPALVTDKIVYQVNGGAPTGTPPFVAVGDIVTFRYTVTNVGGGTAYNVDLTDILPAGFTYQNGSTSVTWPTGSYTSNPTIAGVNLSWDSSAQLAGGQVLTLLFNVTVENAAFIPIPPSGQYENIASATGDDGSGTAIPANNSADVPADTDLDDSDNAFMQPAHPALVVDKSVVSVNGDPARTYTEPGDTVRYRVTIQNVGGAPALSVDLRDTIDANVTYIAGTTNASWNGAFAGSHTADPSIVGSVLTWDSSAIVGGNGTVLSPSATVTYDFSVHVTSSVTQGGTILNTGFGSGVDGSGTAIPANNSANVPADTDLDDTDSVTLPTYKPGLITDKTVALVNGVASTGFIEPGDVITYQYTVQNVGQAVAYNVDITDTLPSSDFTYVPGSSTLGGVGIADPTIAGNDLTWNTNSTIAGGNPTGATITLRFNVTVGSGIHQGTVYTNTNWAVNGTDGDGGAIATDSGDAQDNDLDDSDAVDLTASEPALVTDKIVYQVNGGAPTGTPPIVAVGDIVTFRYTVTNVGNGTAHNVDLTDVLPSGFTYQNGSTSVTWPTGSYTSNPTIAGVNLSWDSSATLAGGQVLTLLFNTTVENAAFIPIPAGGLFENISSATGDDGSGTAIPANNSTDVPADTDLDDSDNAFMQPAHPALVVDKSVVSVNGDPARTYTEPGDTVRYQVTIQNVGGAPALSVDLRDTIDANVTYIAGTTNASWNGAFAGSHTADPSIVGSVLTWDSSAIVGGNGTVLSPGATVTYLFNVHVTSTVTQNGTILNTGFGSGVDGSGTAIPANNSANVPADTDLDDTDSVTLPTYKPGLITDKTVALVNGVASTGFIEPGDVITYQYTVQNVGQAVAYNVDITDTLPSSDFTYVPGSSTLGGVGIADPTIAGNNLTWNTNATIAGGNPTGATITLRFNVTVGSGIHQGTVYTNTNWAVNGTDGDGGAIATDSGDAQDNDLDDSDAVDLTGREPALVTDKVVYLVNGASPSSFPPIAAPGDLITFRYTVTNVGAGTAYNVDLTDILPNGFTYQAGSTVVTWPTGSYTTDPTIAGVNLSWNSSATLAGGQVLTLVFTTLVTNDAYRPLPAGNWINTASAFGDDGAGTAIPADNSTDVPADTDLDDTDTADLIPAQPALVTDKEVVSVNGVPGALYVQPGDYIQYRYTITNVGRGIAFRVNADDTLDRGLSYDPTLVPPTTTSASWTGDYAGSHTTDPAVSGTPPTNESLLWDSPTILGTADGIILTSGATLTYDYSIYVTTYIVQGTPVDNTAHAAAVDGRTTAVPADNSAAVPADTDLDDRDATVLYTREPALVVNKNSSLATVRPGDIVTFTITVQNVGYGDALNLNLVDHLPACFSYISGSTNVTWPSDPTDTVLSPWNSNPTISGNNLYFNIGARLDGGDPTGETLTMRFNALVGSGCPTLVTNHVDAHGVDGDGNDIILGGIDPEDIDDDDADSVDLTVLVPTLSLVKSIAMINGAVPGTTIMSGDTITYEIVIKNTGLAPLTRLVVTDVKPSTIFEYVPGSSTYNGTAIGDPAISGLLLTYDIGSALNAGETAVLRLTFKALSITDGMIYTNCADVVGYDGAGGEINTDESCVDIRGHVPPSDGDITKLRCEVKTSGLNNRLCAGSIASYCVTLFNNDSLPIHDPHLTFVLPVGITLVPGTFVLDGKIMPDPTVSPSGTVDVTLSTVPAKSNSVVCFQMIATADAKLGRIDFEFVITDRTGKSTTCAIYNIITVDDCIQTDCGGFEKLNYPIHECNRLVSLVEPDFDTAYAMYAAGSFYRFSASNVKGGVEEGQTITADYSDLWKFKLFDIAEKNIDAITMRSGLSALVNSGNGQVQVLYRGATPYFDINDLGEARYWASSIDESISTASIGFALFAQAERIFAIKAKTDFLVQTSSQSGLIDETERQMRERVRLLDILINHSSPAAALATGNIIPDTASLKNVNGKAEFVTETNIGKNLETSSAVLLGISRYLQWENTNGNTSDAAAKIGNLAFNSISKEIDNAINSLKPGASGEAVNNNKDDNSSFELRAITIATDAMAEWSRTGTPSKTEAEASIKKIGDFIAKLQSDDGSFSIGNLTSDFKNQVAAIRILSICQTVLGGTDYSNKIFKGYSYIENGLWVDKFGLYRSGNMGGVFTYNPFDLAAYIQNYLNDGQRFKNIGKTSLNSRMHRFLDTILNNGGMQLDDGWRQNEHLLVSSFSTVPKTAVFSVPMGKHLMSVLNSKIEFVDPVAQMPETLIEQDGKNLIQLESLNCNASYAAPSQRQFVTDIGNFALSELYDASLDFSSYTYPTYLMNKLPNTAWMLARKMGEYALYNSFTLDYSSKSGLDLRFSEKLMNEIPDDASAAELKLRELLTQLSVSAGDKFDFNSLSAFRPLFVLFGTALPGVDRSISEQLIINPKLLGYSEDRRIFLSDVGLNLARQANEYRFIEENKPEIKYVLPVLKTQVAASLEFLNRYFLKAETLPSYIYPEINSSGEPLNYIASMEKTDLFSLLSALDGSTSAMQSKDKELSSEAKLTAEKLADYIIQNFYDKNLGRFRNSASDSDLSMVNLYYLNKLGIRISSWLKPTERKLFIDDSAALLKNRIMKGSSGVKVSVDEKPEKVSSIVDINTLTAANFSAMRMALDLYKTTKNNEWLDIAKQIWEAQLNEGYDSILKIFKGSRTSDEKLKEQVIYRYNSFDIGMVIGAVNQIMPYLTDDGRIGAFEGLRVFFDKIVEGAEVQYLPFKERDVFHTGEFDLLPGLRTEVTVKYDDNVVLPRGVFPGETVKFILKLQNNCVRSVASTPESEFDFIDITDILPPRFSYVKGSTYMDGVKGPEPSGDDILYWRLDGNGKEGAILVTFLATVDMNATEGEYINYAKMEYVPAEFGTAYVAPTGWAQSMVKILKASELRMKFFEDVNANGIRDEGEIEHLIPSLKLTLDSITQFSSTKMGTFEPILIKPGYHSLYLPTINPDTYWWLSGNNPIQFHSRMEEDVNLEIPLTYRRIIEGYVFNDLNGNGIYDKENEGLENIELTTSSSGQTVISGEKGYFYYISQFPNETISIKSGQRFTEDKNARIERK